MAKAVRGLPTDFMLDLPDERPVVIGDFLDEAPPAIQAKRAVAATPDPEPVERLFRPEIIRVEEERKPPAPVKKKASAPSVIRYQLNLTPKAKRMLEELVDYVQKYSPESDARTSEVFQGIIGLLHNAMDELELSGLPRRGAWGSVTAKNFPGALSEVFENAILEAVRKRT
jgi:hypothetical protein